VETILFGDAAYDCSQIAFHVKYPLSFTANFQDYMQ